MGPPIAKNFVAEIGGSFRGGRTWENGDGGLGHRGPVTKFEKFSQAEAPPRQRKRTENSGGLDGLVNVY